MRDYSTEADARIVIDDLLRQAGWNPADKSQVLTEAEARRIADSLGFLGKLQATFAEGHYSETPPAHPTA